jgi:hypothetical protein
MVAGPYAYGKARVWVRCRFSLIDHGFQGQQQNLFSRCNTIVAARREQRLVTPVKPFTPQSVSPTKTKIISALAPAPQSKENPIPLIWNMHNHGQFPFPGTIKAQWRQL